MVISLLSGLKSVNVTRLTSAPLSTKNGICLFRVSTGTLKVAAILPGGLFGIPSPGFNGIPGNFRRHGDPITGLLAPKFSW